MQIALQRMQFSSVLCPIIHFKVGVHENIFISGQFVVQCSIIHLKNFTSKYNPLLKVYMFNLVAQGRMCGHVVVDNHGNNLMVLGRRIWDASDSHKRWQHLFSYGKHFEGEALAWHGRHMAMPQLTDILGWVDPILWHPLIQEYLWAFFVVNQK